MKIVVLGYIVRGPLGGLVWHHFQYVLGLKNLGYEVLFLEDSDDYPACYHPDTFQVNTDPSYGLAFIDSLFRAYNMQSCWAYYDFHTHSWFGRTQKEVFDFCNRAEIIFNISAVNPLRDWWAAIPNRVLIDTDPGFTQIKHLSDPSAMRTARHHTHFFSFGEKVGMDDCLIPDDGMEWKATRQPVFAEAWKVGKSLQNERWTTVMQWDSYKSKSYNGIPFEMKSFSFKQFEALPSRMPGEHFELALGGVTAPADDLQKRGWNVISSLIPTTTPERYQQYIANSKGEWTVAKHGYVVSNSGWFSERSAGYLASGKPVVAQNTGFSEILPTGQGLFAFKTIEEAEENIEIVNRDYHFHCGEARRLAEDYFDSSKVLLQLLKNV